MCGKLAPRFFGPFKILAKRGPVAYELALPTHIIVHNVFHAPLLKKYVYDTKHVINSSLLQEEPEGEFSLNIFIYWTRERCISGSTLLSNLKCNGSTSKPMRLLGIMKQP